jgi:hypothetical protein
MHTNNLKYKPLTNKNNQLTNELLQDKGIQRKNGNPMLS